MAVYLENRYLSQFVRPVVVTAVVAAAVVVAEAAAGAGAVVAAAGAGAAVVVVVAEAVHPEFEPSGVEVVAQGFHAARKARGVRLDAPVSSALVALP